jgi:putative SOS response-associated peptidase YedK
MRGYLLIIKAGIRRRHWPFTFFGRNRQALSTHAGSAGAEHTRPLQRVPTTTIDRIVGRNGARALVPMRWGLVPHWWHRPLTELRAATFNARSKTVETKPFFRDAFEHNRCLIPMSGHVRRLSIVPC